MRILIVQYAGDYREAYQRLQTSGTETYYGHRYVLEQLGRLQTLGDVAMMCCLSPEQYDEHLPNGVNLIGAQLHPRRKAGELKRLMAEWNPTHLVVLGPLTGVIRWAVGSGRRVMCVMADSFAINPLSRMWKYGRLSALLNDPRVDWVANHGVNACGSLVRIGVEPTKIIAWDYPHARRPSDVAPRELSRLERRTMLYVGSIQTKKGVGDAIEAVAELKRRGITLHLEIAGDGQLARFREQVGKSGIADRVEFLGLIPNAEVFERMRGVDIVVVPSRHDYPEGLPLTIYEALSARTPIIASDHPMFEGHIVDGEAGLVYPARKPIAMANKIESLISDAVLYKQLSCNTSVAWERLQNSIKWGDLLYRWLRDTDEDRAWLEDARPTALSDAYDMG